jgi:GAF domain-containing protein
VNRTPPGRLVDSGQLLTSSLDYDITLRRVARLPIPEHADWCVVYAPHRGAALTTRLAIAHANLADEAALRSIMQRQPFELPRQHPLLEVVRTGQPLCVAECAPEHIASLAGTRDYEHVLLDVGVRSFMALPLIAHERCVGGLMLVGSRSNRHPYTQVSVDTFAGLASAAAHAIDNACLFSEAKLALRLRDEVIRAASTELLGLMETVRQRTEGLRWKSETEAQTMVPSASSSVTEIDELADEMEQLIGELRLIAAAQTSRQDGRARRLFRH